jgi:hypothetical protein
MVTARPTAAAVTMTTTALRASGIGDRAVSGGFGTAYS